MINNKKGFTLAELTISLAVLGIIASGLMLLTASTVSKTYNRRINYMFKNECQNVASCFSISDLYLDSSEGELNVDSLISSLEFYYIDNTTYAEYLEFGLPDDTFVPFITSSSGKIVLSWTYDVTFKQSESTQYTFSLVITYGNNTSIAYNTATLSMYITKGSEVITEVPASEEVSDKILYSKLQCVIKEVPTV